MTPKLKELRAIAEKATPGPYHISHISECKDDRVDVADQNLIDIGEEFLTKDALYLCAMNPKTTLVLLDIIESQREALEYYRGMTTVCTHDDSSWCDHCPDGGKRARKALALTDKRLQSLEGLG